MSENEIEFDSGETGSSLVSETDLIAEARELVMSNQREEALKVINKALKINKSNPDSLWMYANLTPKAEQAVSSLKALLRIQPDNEKARTMLKNLEATIEAIDPFDVPSSTGLDKDKQIQEMMKRQEELERRLKEQQTQQPVINITNTTTSSVGAGYRPIPVEERNQTAFVIGLLVAIFLNTFGVAHIINGKVGTGIIQLLAGWLLWAPFSVAVSTGTVGVGLCVILPIHILMAYNSAKAGARRVYLAA